MSTPVVRVANHHDIPSIVRFNAAMASETERKQLDLNTLTRGVEAILSDSTKGIYYVAESEGRAVGQLLITYEWSDWRNANFWWIQSVYVEKEYRGRGIFRSLFHHVVALARNRPDVCGIRLYVERANTKAQKVYEQLGMQRSHYDMFEMDLTTLTEVDRP
jgi:GNAT superfamily N-acetyltransferase